MPNCCTGNLSIKCSEELLEQVKKYVKSEESEFDFNNIVPMPEHIYRGSPRPEESQMYGKDNRYNWSCEHWGTKWKAVNARSEGPDFCFETAWTPCSPVIAALAKQFPGADMRYTYCAEGNAFCGVEEYHNGKLVYALNGDYCEHTLDEEGEGPEWDIPESVLENPQLALRNELFLPTTFANGKVGGKLYLKDWCDKFWGYEITALVAYEGEKPACWY